MNTFWKCFMWFMIGDTVGLITLLFWQGICSLNKREPTRPMTKFDKITQSPEKLAEFIFQHGSGEGGFSIEGIAEYLKQKVGKE